MGWDQFKFKINSGQTVNLPCVTPDEISDPSDTQTCTFLNLWFTGLSAHRKANKSCADYANEIVTEVWKGTATIYNLKRLKRSLTNKIRKQLKGGGMITSIWNMEPYWWHLKWAKTTVILVSQLTWIVTQNSRNYMFNQNAIYFNISFLDAAGQPRAALDSNPWSLHLQHNLQTSNEVLDTKSQFDNWLF